MCKQWVTKVKFFTPWYFPLAAIGSLLHRADTDFEIDEYVIPKGSIIFLSNRGLLYDRKVKITHNWRNTASFSNATHRQPFWVGLILLNISISMLLSFYVFKIWGDDVDTFQPDRWFDETDEIRSVPEFIPFGIGMFRCLKSVRRRKCLSGFCHHRLSYLKAKNSSHTMLSLWALNPETSAIQIWCFPFLTSQSCVHPEDYLTVFFLPAKLES